MFSRVPLPFHAGLAFDSPIFFKNVLNVVEFVSGEMLQYAHRDFCKTTTVMNNNDLSQQYIEVTHARKQ